MDAYIPYHCDRLDPRASPMPRESLSGLLPALISSAGFDQLVDENEAYAKRLDGDGVATQYVYFPDMIHTLFNSVT